MQNDVARGLQNPFLSTKSKGKSEASEERLEARLDVVPGEASGAEPPNWLPSLKKQPETLAALRAARRA